MKPYYSDDAVTIYHADCAEVLPTLDPVDLVLTDPPYSLSVASDHENRRGKGTRRLDFFRGDQDWAAMTAGVVQRVGLAADLAAAAYVWCGHRQFGPLTAALEDAPPMTAGEAPGAVCGGVVAQVVDLKASGDRAVLGLPREPVGVLLPATAGDGRSPVARLRDLVLPDPARRRVAKILLNPVRSFAKPLASGVVPGDVEHWHALDPADLPVRGGRDGCGLAASALAQPERYFAHAERPSSVGCSLTGAKSVSATSPIVPRGSSVSAALPLFFRCRQSTGSVG